MSTVGLPDCYKNSFDDQKLQFLGENGANLDESEMIVMLSPDEDTHFQ